MVPVKEDYTMVTGKRRHCTNQGNQQVFHFKNGRNVALDLEFRVYNDGIAFRYVFREGITRWIQKLGQAYEDFQHLADRPEGYHAQPAEVRAFISSLPTVWEDTKLLDGYPSHHVVMARKNGDCWYIGGLNGTNESLPLTVDLSFIPENIQEITLYADGEKRHQFAIRQLSGTEKHVQVDCLPRGGFVMTVKVQPQ